MKTMGIFMLVILLVSCSPGSKTSKTQDVTTYSYVPSPPAIIYKTKKDYSDHVPVILSEDRSVIVSFPHPSDLRSGNSLQSPSILEDGYFLDNRGINKNVAFLKFTYDEYAWFDKVLTADELFEFIIDSDPLIEMCDCGTKSSFKDIESELNELIHSKKLYEKCKKIY